MSEDVRRLVGRNARRLRIAAGLSQAELAERMGVDRAYVSGLELGQRNPTVVTLWHVAQALGVGLAPFFKGEKQQRGSVTGSIRGCVSPRSRLARSAELAKIDLRSAAKSLTCEVRAKFGSPLMGQHRR